MQSIYTKQFLGFYIFQTMCFNLKENWLCNNDLMPLNWVKRASRNAQEPCWRHCKF